MHFYICTQLCDCYKSNKLALMHDIISCKILGWQFKCGYWFSKQIVNREEIDLQFFNKILYIRVIAHKLFNNEYFSHIEEYFRKYYFSSYFIKFDWLILFKYQNNDISIPIKLVQPLYKQTGNVRNRFSSCCMQMFSWKRGTINNYWRLADINW